LQESVSLQTAVACRNVAAGNWQLAGHRDVADA
jgi:hypothetical protein